jgi:hypothetical protein
MKNGGIKALLRYFFVAYHLFNAPLIGVFLLLNLIKISYEKI